MTTGAGRLAALSLAGLLACHTGVSLSGTDSDPEAQALGFGSVLVGNQKPLLLRITNQGSATLIPGMVSLSGPNAADFTVQGTLPQEAAGEAAELTVVFAPSLNGPERASLQLQSNSATMPVLSVALAGAGESASLTVSPTALSFGNQPTGSSTSLLVTVSNSGTSLPVTLALGSPQGPAASQFLVDTPSDLSLLPGQSLQIPVSFVPTQSEAASASFSVAACPACAPLNVSLAGNGEYAAVTLIPDPVLFPNVPVGETVDQNVRIANVGQVPVELTSVSLQTTGNGPFSLSTLPTLPMGLNPDAGLSMQVSFTAQQTTAARNALVVTYTATGSPTQQTVLAPVEGDVVYQPCQLAVQPAVESFGSVQPNQPVTKTLVFRNHGGIACHVSGLALTSSSDPGFSLAPQTPSSFTVPPVSASSVTLQFAISNPAPPNRRQGTLAFTSDDLTLAAGSVPLVAYLNETSPYAAGWPKWHMDNADHGQSEADTSWLQGVVAWTYALGSATPVFSSYRPSYLNSPVVGPDGTVYQTTMDGHLDAIDPSGSLRWAASISSPRIDPHPSTPVIAADGTLFVESGADSLPLTGINLAALYHFAPDGSLLYEVPPPTMPCVPTTDNNGNPICAPADGFDVCPSIGNDGLLFDGDDFGQTMSYAAQPNGSFAEQDVILLPFVGCERVSVALDPQDDSFWCCGNQCFGISAPGAGFQQLPGWYSRDVSNDAPAAGAFDVDNSDLAYDSRHTQDLMVSIAWQDLPSGTARTEFSCLDPATGSIQWTYKMPFFTPPQLYAEQIDPILFGPYIGNAAPAIGDDGTVYVGNGDGLYAVDGATGQLRPGFPFSSADVTTAPAIGGDGTIFFGCADGSIYAVNPDGTQRFQVHTGATVSGSPAIGPDGTVYFVNDDGTLFAIQ